MSVKDLEKNNKIKTSQKSNEINIEENTITNTILATPDKNQNSPESEEFIEVSNKSEVSNKIENVVDDKISESSENNQKDMILEKVENVNISEKAENSKGSENNKIIPTPPKKIETTGKSNDTIKKSKFGITKTIFITILTLLIISAIAFSIFVMVNSKSDKIYSGISIMGIDVSGLTTQESKEKINKYISDNLPENIRLKHLDFETSIPISSLEASFDVDSAVKQANEIGKSGNIFENEFNIIKTFFSKKDIEPTLNINNKQLVTSLNDISGKLPDTVINSGYYIEGNNLIITKGKEGNIVNTSEMVTYIKNGITNLTLKNRILNISTKTKKPAKIDIEKIYEQIHKEPVNASYTKEPFTVYPSENGVDFAISIDEAKALVEDEEKEEYIIPLKVLYPSITTNMIGTEAFPDLLSTFSTNYSAAAVGRTTNLKLAASKINGTVIMPGETFSYNKVVGARTIAAGYKEAPIYVQGKVVDGLGGGICQITSTLYNAVVFANLEVVERTNHQFVPSYVSASRDATVVYGSLDFKFKNNRNYPIKLICSVSGGVANFQIFGLKTEDDYNVEISSYVTGRTSSAIYSEAYKILKKNGQVVDKVLLSKDVYKAH